MAFNDTVMAATKRRNVTPTTTTLDMIVEDFDCSGFDAAPEDGQFIVALPGAELATLSAPTAANIDALSEKGSALRMVWGSSLRSDRAALGDTRVPVILRGGGRFKTKLFLTGGDTPQNDGYTPGAALTVANPATAYKGSTNRLILAPLQETGDACGWVVGYVVQVTNNSSVAGVGEIEVMLYSEPRAVTDNAQA